MHDDNDGHINSSDFFPNDSLEWADGDDDGTGSETDCNDNDAVDAGGEGSVIITYPPNGRVFP